MEARLALYDILTRLVPGGFFLWALHLLWPNLSGSIPGPGTGEIANGGAWFVLSYVAGYALDHMGRMVVEPLARAIGGGNPARRWLVDHPKVGDQERTELRQLAEQSIGIEQAQFAGTPDSARECSARAFRIALALCEDTSEKVKAIRAQYGLNRTITSACFTLLILGAVKAVAVPHFWIYPVGFLLIGLVFLLGTRHYDTALVRNVFQVALTPK